jgi:hypothetical protein
MPSPTHPFFLFHDSFFGLGIVGGPMHSLVEGSRGTAAIGSEIHFRDPTAWDQYRVQILLICAVVLVQSELIGRLILHTQETAPL